MWQNLWLEYPDDYNMFIGDLEIYNRRAGGITAGMYFDNPSGMELNPEYLTYHEALSRQCMSYMFEPGFFTFSALPKEYKRYREYVLEECRLFALSWIHREFDREFLGMQDYNRWADKFRNRLYAICDPFWSLANLDGIVDFIDMLYDDGWNESEHNNKNTSNTTDDAGGRKVITENEHDNGGTSKGKTQQIEGSDTRHMVSSLPKTAGIVDDQLYLPEGDNGNYIDQLTRTIQTGGANVSENEQTQKGTSRSVQTTTGVFLRGLIGSATGKTRGTFHTKNKQLAFEFDYIWQAFAKHIPLNFLKQNLSDMFLQIW